MAWRILTIALLLASAAPPPRVTNALIAATHRHDKAESGKTIQSRARNRISSTIHLASRREESGHSRGRSRPDPSPRSLARGPDTPPTLRRSSPAPLAPFRLRC